MKKMLLSALLAASLSAGAIAYAQVKDPLAPPSAQMTPMEALPPATISAPDARSLASDEEVGEARRYYRAQCSEHESAAFCDCVTAGVAQALMPAEVRIAARTVGERITAQGDALVTSESDGSFAAAASSAQRIERVEGHYADACASYR